MNQTSSTGGRTCPHCLAWIHDKPTSVGFSSNQKALVQIEFLDQRCPACGGTIVDLQHYEGVWSNQVRGSRRFDWKKREKEVVFPKSHGRKPCPSEVPPALSSLYEEACHIAAASPRASAALSRRCLEEMLVDKGLSPKLTLDKMVTQALDTHVFPGYLAENIDVVRATGNFGAHPIEDKQTGLIVDVDPAAAELQLDLLEESFDHLYVKPAKFKKGKDATDANLAAAGKPATKNAPPQPPPAGASNQSTP